MKTYFYLLTIFIFFFAALAASAQADLPTGARAAALGNASVTLHDVWAMQNNIAGVSALTQPAIGAYAENRFGIRAFTTAALHAVYPTSGYGNYGLSFSRFGDELYNQQHLGVGAAHKLGQFSLGAKVDVWQISAQGYGSQKAIAISVGGQAEVVPGLYFGAYAYNLNQAKLAAFEDERLPTIMKAGLSYKPIKKVLLAIESEKNIDHDANFKAGVEYTVIQEKLILRTGFSTLTNQSSFGLGFVARSFKVDYAFTSATQLGQSHHLSVSYHVFKPNAKVTPAPLPL